MRVRRAGSKVIVEEAPILVPAVFFASAIVLLILGVLIDLGLYTHEQPAWAAFLLALGSLAVAALFLRRDRNVFDQRTGRLTWSRRSLLGTSGGEIPFQDITAVTVETQTTSQTIPSARLAVHTGTTALPLTRIYSGTAASHEPVALLLRDVIGLSRESLTEDSLRALVESGRKINAVRLLRIKEGISLAEAKARIDRQAKPTADRN